MGVAESWFLYRTLIPHDSRRARWNILLPIIPCTLGQGTPCCRTGQPYEGPAHHSRPLVRTHVKPQSSTFDRHGCKAIAPLAGSLSHAPAKAQNPRPLQWQPSAQLLDVIQPPTHTQPRSLMAQILQHPDVGAAGKGAQMHPPPPHSRLAGVDDGKLFFSVLILAYLAWSVGVKVFIVLLSVFVFCCLCFSCNLFFHVWAGPRPCPNKKK